VERHGNSGFTLLEALMVMAISLVLAAVAAPIASNAINAYYLNATVSAASGAISSTRMQAIMHGYSYQLVFSPSVLTYQVIPSVGASTTIPLPNAGGVSMQGWINCPLTNPQTLIVLSCTKMTAGATITYTFAANGTVSFSPASSPAAVGMQISNKVSSNTIWVSGVGYVSTSTP